MEISKLTAVMVAPMETAISHETGTVFGWMEWFYCMSIHSDSLKHVSILCYHLYSFIMKIILNSEEEYKKVAHLELVQNGFVIAEESPLKSAREPRNDVGGGTWDGKNLYLR